jgi:hypothetical protein
MLAPNVAATVAPTAAKPIEAAAVAQPKAAAPAAPQFAGPQPDVRATLPPTALNGTHSKNPPSTGSAPAAIKKPSTNPRTRLRGRKVGEDTPRLNVRIKDARDRKPRPSAKATRKSVVASASPKRLKTATGSKALEKPPARRIGLKAEDRNLLASAKAATKIVGVPQRSPRVLGAVTP